MSTTMQQMLSQDQINNYLGSPQVLIEITSKCNFACEHCSSPFRERKKTEMSEELFKRIVDQIPGLTDKKIRLHIDGEPTMHSKFHQFAKYANSLGIGIALATNGSLLKPEYLDIKADLLITISPAASELARRHKKLNFDRYHKTVIDYVKAWLNTDNEQVLNICVLQAPQMHTDENYSKWINDFMIQFAQESNLDSLKSSKPNQYIKDSKSRVNLSKAPTTEGGLYPIQGVKDDPKRVTEGFCDSPWKRLAILADGRVSCCCIDLSGGTAFTDDNEIWNKSLKDIWLKNSQINSIRNNFNNCNVELPICQKCLGAKGDANRIIGFSG